MIRDPAGNFYGTTCCGGSFGYGTVFELDSSGVETVLYNFTGGADGANPYAGVIRDPEGNLYGTTYFGGVSGPGAADGYGVVFKLDTTGAETVLYTFSGGTDGGGPWTGPLLRDSAGNLYGTALSGGSHRTGVVFKLDTSGAETVLHEFTRGADGASPRAGLVQDAEGNLYGTAEEGGMGPNCCGVVFKLDQAGHETVLYTFTGGGDGASPWAGLVRDSDGNIYGTTVLGGARQCGIVFEVEADGHETQLYSFNGGEQGANPYAGLFRDRLGNLYGTTSDVGAQGLGNGAVFGLKP